MSPEILIGLIAMGLMKDWMIGQIMASWLRTQECEIKLLLHIGIHTTYVGDMVPYFSPV